MEEPNNFEESHELSQVWNWIIVIGFSAAILTWGMFIMLMVPDVPRQWDFSAQADVPAESIYSTLEPDRRSPTPRQIQPLPEARPLASAKATSARASSASASRSDSAGRSAPESSSAPTSNSAAGPASAGAQP